MTLRLLDQFAPPACLHVGCNLFFPSCSAFLVVTSGYLCYCGLPIAYSPMALASTSYFVPENHYSLDIFCLLESVSVNPGDACIGKSQQISSLLNTQTSPTIINNHAMFRVT